MGCVKRTLRLAADGRAKPCTLLTAPLLCWLQAEDDAQEEVLLDDGPPLTAAPAAPRPTAAAAAPAPPEPAPAAGGLGDPLSLAASSSGEEAAPPRYHDVVGAQQHAAPPAAPLAAAPLGAAGAADTAPHHRQQASLTLDSLEINADDAGFLRGRSIAGGASGSGSAGAGPSTSAAPPPLHITVSDPVRRVGDSVIPGLASTHFEYLVTTAGEAPRRQVEVRRRFKDFVVSGWVEWGWLGVVEGALRGCSPGGWGWVQVHIK